MRLILLISLLLTSPVMAAVPYCYFSNLEQKTYCPSWGKSNLKYYLDTDLPHRSEVDTFIHQQIDSTIAPATLTITSDSSEADIKVLYSNTTGGVPGTTVRISSKEKVQSATTTIYKNWQEFVADPVIALKNIVLHEFGHSVATLDHTTQFVFDKLPFPDMQQPLMAAGGRVISPGWSYDDINGFYKSFNKKIKMGRAVSISGTKTYNNYWLVNKRVKQYSLSQKSPDFTNVYPGDYYILVKDGNTPVYICKTNGNNFKPCTSPKTTSIQKNLKIKIL